MYLSTGIILYRSIKNMLQRSVSNSTRGGSPKTPLPVILDITINTENLMFDEWINGLNYTDCTISISILLKSFVAPFFQSYCFEMFMNFAKTPTVCCLVIDNVTSSPKHFCHSKQNNSTLSVVLHYLGQISILAFITLNIITHLHDSPL